MKGIADSDATGGKEDKKMLDIRYSVVVNYITRLSRVIAHT
jgi:hypothetical protein